MVGGQGWNGYDIQWPEFIDLQNSSHSCTHGLLGLETTAKELGIVLDSTAVGVLENALIFCGYRQDSQFKVVMALGSKSQVQVRFGENLNRYGSSFRLLAFLGKSKPKHITIDGFG